jgi:hypothetical protein
MPQPLTVPLPPNIDLWDSCVLRVAAIDPTDGSIVSGVTVSDVTIECVQLAGQSLDSGSFKLVPGPGA